MRTADINIADRFVVWSSAPCLVEADDDPLQSADLFTPHSSAYYTKVTGRPFESPIRQRRTEDGGNRDFVPVTVEAVGVPYRRGRTGVTVVGENGERFTVHCSSLSTEIGAEVTRAVHRFETEDFVRTTLLRRGWTRTDSGWRSPPRDDERKG
jgi:hypothetical protein